MSGWAGRTGVAIVGDLMLGRHMTPLIAHHGLASLLAEVCDEAAGRPLIANLECPLADVTLTGGPGPRFVAPPSLAADLRAAGVAAVSLANNHILDCGDDGLLSTIAALDGAGVPHTGAGQSRSAATEPVVLDVGGVRVGLVAFSYIRPATEEHAGIAALYDGTVDSVIARVRPMVDFVIAMPHAGIELFRYPLPRDQALYRGMIDAGADLVVGGHPHCIQAAEIHHGRPIYYSAGDCLFDHHVDEIWQRFWSGGAHPKRYGLTVDSDVPRFSLMITVDFGGEAPLVRHVPFKLDERPRLLNAVEGKAWSLEFAALGERLHHDPVVHQQRKSIEEDLLATLQRRVAL